MNRTACRVLVASVACLLIFATSSRAGETIVDETRGFKLTLPDEFVPNPKLIETGPDIVHGFSLGDPADDKLDILLLIEKLNGTIDRKRLT